MMLTSSCHPERTSQLRLKRRSWLILLLLIPTLAHAGVVQTRTERLAGALSFTESGVKIGDKSVPWNEASIVLPGTLPTIGDSSVVHLATGELWAVDVRKMMGKKLHVQSSLLGERDLDLAAIRAIDFLSGMSLSDKSDPATLYRDSGEPLPGTVLWIDPTRLAIDSPLGALTLSREGILRYVFKADPKAAPASTALLDEVRLTDGSLFKGTATSAKDSINLDHPLLGKITIPAKAIRSIIRHPAGVTYITSFPSDSLKLTPLIAPAISAGRVQPPNDQLAATAIPLEPNTTIHYKLPAHTSALSFHCGLVPAPNSRGTIHFTLEASAKSLFDGVIKPGDAPQSVRVELPEGDELTLTVAFSKTVSFPCSVVLLDPLLTGP